MKSYTLKVREADRAIYDAIASGAKKVETRAATSRYGGIQAGDELVFACGKDRLRKKILKAGIYKNAKSLVRAYDPVLINPDAATLADLEVMYASFPGYAEKIAAHGIIALELE